MLSSYLNLVTNLLINIGELFQTVHNGTLTEIPDLREPENLKN